MLEDTQSWSRLRSELRKLVSIEDHEPVETAQLMDSNGSGARDNNSTKE
eukprot:CAMPEP_0172157408 /NCGR_PEP_ID=MMETSP1050-20130122/3769_1 /TAXON_ID=233186 /ORGANISM="Cryptomonas curvata, Strain CCAP979/52" /LENGTH=48 /DNA_ID= /DNA_START= /DNA_END= /DNA_ORIENTATION=